MLLNYGQPLGAIHQFAYTVPDIQAAMNSYVTRAGIGPWFLTGPFVPAKGVYRGEPTDMKVSLAIAFTGHMTIELIQQHDDKPSVYRELIEQRGYGFHHWAKPTKSFDDDVARYEKMGYEVAFTDIGPRGNRVAYLDTTADLPGMLEFTEYSEQSEAIYTMFYKASLDWDGSDPVRAR